MPVGTKLFEYSHPVTSSSGSKQLAEYLRTQMAFSEDGSTLVWTVSRHRIQAGQPVGTVTFSRGKNYRYVKISGTSHPVHRLVWLLNTGEYPSVEIDHLDGNGLNNRFDNMRLVPHLHNCWNRKRSVLNTSGCSGVTYSRRAKKWHSRINVNMVDVHLGYFTEKEEAVLARKRAEIEYGFHPNHDSVRPL